MLSKKQKIALSSSVVIAAIGTGAFITTRVYENSQEELAKKKNSTSSISCSYDEAKSVFEIKLTPGGDLLSGESITKSCKVPEKVPNNWILSSTPEPIWSTSHGNRMKDQYVFLRLKTTQNPSSREVSLSITPDNFLKTTDGKDEFIENVISKSFPITFSKEEEEAFILKLQQQQKEALEKLRKDVENKQGKKVTPLPAPTSPPSQSPKTVQ